jgi:hypothetical protein
VKASYCRGWIKERFKNGRPFTYQFVDLDRRQPAAPVHRVSFFLSHSRENNSPRFQFLLARVHYRDCFIRALLYSPCNTYPVRKHSRRSKAFPFGSRLFFD